MKIKVRVAVAANSDGQWQAYGFQDAEWDEAMDAFDTLPGEQRFWIEAEIEVADAPAVVVGAAITADND